MRDVAGCLLVLAACGVEPRAPAPDANATMVGDAAEPALPEGDPSAIPQFSTVLYIDVAEIARISRFRASVGHDFSDSFESCRSMKHYFFPRASIDWTTLVVRAPAAATVVRLEAEQTIGTQIYLAPIGHPDFVIRIFHVTPSPTLAVGSLVDAGDPLGTHATDQTFSDIAIEQYRGDGFRLASYIDTLAAPALAVLAARGVPAPSALIISAAERDADPLTCDGGLFVDPGVTPSWFELP